MVEVFEEEAEAADAEDGGVELAEEEALAGGFEVRVCVPDEGAEGLAGGWGEGFGLCHGFVFFLWFVVGFAEGARDVAVCFLGQGRGSGPWWCILKEIRMARTWPRAAYAAESACNGRKLATEVSQRARDLHLAIDKPQRETSKAGQISSLCPILGRMER